MCTFGPVLTIIAAAVFFGGWLQLAQSMSAATPNAPKYRIVAVFSADFCGPCKTLEAHLRKNGYQVKVTEITDQPAIDSFPAVYYVAPNGGMVRDNGQKIYNGQVASDKPVQIIHWRTK